MRLYSSAALIGVLFWGLLQAGPGGCTLGTVDPLKAVKLVVTASKGEKSATLHITATNMGDRKLTLRFNSAKHFDFLAREKDSKRFFWQWSFGRSFTDTVADEELRPGQSLNYEGEMPYEGLPATQFEIYGFITKAPTPIKTEEAAILDITDKKVGVPSAKHIVGEIHFDAPAGSPPTVFIQTLHGVKYALAETPEVFRNAEGFPIEAWLTGPESSYELADYVWVMAPLPENGQLFLPQFVRYAKTGGIAGIYKGIKIYGDGSFIASCCRPAENVKSGYAGSFEGLLQFLTAQRISDMRNQYGKPNQVADGFDQYLEVQARKYHKQINVFQDPKDPAPEAFATMAEHLSELVKLTDF